MENRDDANAAAVCRIFANRCGIFILKIKICIKIKSFCVSIVSEFLCQDFPHAYSGMFLD